MSKKEKTSSVETSKRYSKTVETGAHARDTETNENPQGSDSILPIYC
jgi:hypothetical protein